jgi:multidrug efflux pump subunit AcrA (membrane-fusion protein)
VGADVSFAVAQHNVTAQENLLKQLRQQQDYASVIAPFDGVITRRNCSLPAPMPTGMGATARY